jgi:hypothetical protein
VSPGSNHVRCWHLLLLAAQNAGNGYLAADHFFGDFLIFAGRRERRWRFSCGSNVIYKQAEINRKGNPPGLQGIQAHAFRVATTAASVSGQRNLPLSKATGDCPFYLADLAVIDQKQETGSAGGQTATSPVSAKRQRARLAKNGPRN